MPSKRKRRPNIAQTTVDDLMFRNRHTCCICRSDSMDVQIHHIDSNHSNNDIDNLAVLCLDHHSRATGNRGLGRRYSPGEVKKYKWEWEGLNMSKLGTTSSLSEVEKSMLRADIARLTVKVIALKDDKRRLEALEQIESYSIYFDLRDEALGAVYTILLGGVWGEAVVTSACAEMIHHLFWGNTVYRFEDDYPPLKDNDVAALKRAIEELDWIGKHATEYMRSKEVMRSLCTSILYLYEIAAVYSKSDIGVSLLSTVETTLKACSVETEFKGCWVDGVRQIRPLLTSLQEMTPKKWKKAGIQIQQLLDSTKPFRRRMF